MIRLFDKKRKTLDIFPSLKIFYALQYFMEMVLLQINVPRHDSRKRSAILTFFAILHKAAEVFFEVAL